MTGFPTAIPVRASRCALVRTAKSRRLRTGLPQPGPEAAAEDGRREIFICSRDSELSDELMSLFADRGHRCTLHRNPWAARTAARRSLPDLVAIDWRLGEQVATKLASAPVKPRRRGPASSARDSAYWLVPACPSSYSAGSPAATWH